MIELILINGQKMMEIYFKLYKKLDEIKNFSEPPQCRSCYSNYKERYLKYTKKQLERRKIGVFLKVIGHSFYFLNNYYLSLYNFYNNYV